MKNKSGLSTIIVTLLIILISLVAVGIVWAVVNNLVKGGSEGVEISAKCLNTLVEPTKVNCSNGVTNIICDAQLMRTGNDVIGGVKLIFRNSTSGASSSSAIRLEGDIEALVGLKKIGIDTGVPNAAGVDTLEITAFFKMKSGDDRNCDQTGSFSDFS